MSELYTRESALSIHLGKRSVDAIHRKVVSIAKDQRLRCAEAVKLAIRRGDDPVKAAMNADIDKDSLVVGGFTEDE